jgi:hypothetical protein
MAGAVLKLTDKEALCTNLKFLFYLFIVSEKSPMTPHKAFSPWMLPFCFNLTECLSVSVF